MERGKYAEADQTLNEALEIERNVFGPDNQRIAAIEADLGALYQREGDPERAMALTQDAVRIIKSRLGAGHYLTGYYLDSLADLYLKDNKLEAAESHARQALAVYAQALPAQHLYVAGTRQLLGEVLLRRGQLAQAEAEVRTALDIDTALAGPGNWRTARTEATLGWILIAEDKAAEGEPLLHKAQIKLLKMLGAQHPEVVQATSRLSDYYHAHHRDADAAQLLATDKHPRSN
jgi:eukaryotic-like serine/threonine-protein kinase